MFCFSSRSSDTFSSSSPFPGRPFAFPVLFWHFKGGVGAASEIFQGIIYMIILVLMAKIQKLMIPIFSLITFAATFCPVMLSFRRRRSKIIKFIYQSTATYHFVSLYWILFVTRGQSRLTCCRWPPAWSPGPGICGGPWLGSLQPPPRPPAAADQAPSRKAEVRI